MKHRLVIRARGRGPVGFINLTAPEPSAPAGGITYALVRSTISEQLCSAWPDESYVFLLEGGVPVAPSQEDHEVAEGLTDCFVAFFSGGSTLAGGPAAASPGAFQVDLPPWSREMLTSVPSGKMVQQWVESFGFMDAKEQQEALSYLQLCFPAARAALASASPVRSTARHASSTPTGSGARRTPRQGRSTPQVPSAKQSPMPSSSATGQAKLRRSLSGVPCAPYWQGSPRPASGTATCGAGGSEASGGASATNGSVPEPMAAAAAAGVESAAADESGGVTSSLDAMLVVEDGGKSKELKEMRSEGDEFVTASGSPGLEAADSSLDQQLLELYRSGIGNSLNASSSILSASTPAAQARSPPKRSPGKAATPDSASPRRQSTYHHDTAASWLRRDQHNQRSSHGAGPKGSVPSGAAGVQINGWTNGLRDSRPPGAHSTSSPKKQGTSVSPIKAAAAASIAFGSARPQRPSSAGRLATGAVPHLGRHGSISGIF